MLHNSLLKIKKYPSLKTDQQHDTSQMSVQRILKRIKFYPMQNLCKIYFVQELNEDNRRNEFCELMMQRIDEELNLFYSFFE